MSLKALDAVLAALVDHDEQPVRMALVDAANFVAAEDLESALITLVDLLANMAYIPDDDDGPIYGRP